jgi:hypothetical protein
MRKTLLLAVLVLAVACGTYHFPGQPPSGSGTISGQVTTVGCGMVPTANVMCVAPPVPKPACAPDGSGGTSCGTVPAPTIVCPADPAAGNSCGPGYPCRAAGAAMPYPCGAPVPVPGLELDFTSGGSTLSTTTDSNGNYTIGLPADTWTVSTKNYMQIVSGPTTVIVTAGASLVANYTVWSKMAYLSA